MPEPALRARKLILGAVVTVAAIGLSPYLYQYLGWIPALRSQAWVVLAITSIFLLLKLYIGDRAADGEFLFYKYGYDNCIVTFGATLTALSLQLQSPTDLFPGLSLVGPLGAVAPPGTPAPRALQLFLLLLATLLASLFTAHIAGEIKRAKKSDRGFWSLLNSAVGLAMLAMYVLILITKG